MSTDWKAIASIPKQHNYDQFLIVFDKPRNSIFAITERHLFEYSSRRNQWMQHNINNPLPVRIWLNMPCTINSKTQTIYIINRKGAVIQLQLNKTNKKWIEHQNISQHAIDGGQSFIINNELHVIGGNLSINRHLKLNQNTNQLIHLHQMDKMVNAPGSTILNQKIIQTQDKLIMFGGCQNQIDALDIIREYDIKKDKWQELDIKMPSVLWNGFGVTTFFCQQYILILSQNIELTLYNTYKCLTISYESIIQCAPS